MAELSNLPDQVLDLVERAAAALGRSDAWAALALEKTPALALGIAVMTMMLPLAVLGLALGRFGRTPRSPRPRAETIVRSGHAASPRTGALRTGTPATGEAPRWPADAWVEIVGGSIVWIGRRMVRIGRDDDNEIRLPAGTVHRHHAVIHHTEDADFMIKDLSSADGNGVVVNGRRVGTARLRHGDTVMLGEAILKFHLRPA